MSREKQKILVIAPHPDDDLIGCGGSMAKHLTNGNTVYVIYVTYGNAENSEYPLEEFTEIRKAETLSAAKVIGLKEEDLFFLGEYPWKLNLERVRFALLELVRKIQPNLCCIPHLDDVHADHRIVGQVALDAISMAPGKWFRPCGSSWNSFPAPTILAYEVWTPLSSPSYLEDITAFLEKKMEALREHKTQAIDRYEAAYRGMNAYRGAMHGTGKYAEAFQVIRIPRLPL